MFRVFSNIWVCLHLTIKITKQIHQLYFQVCFGFFNFFSFCLSNLSIYQELSNRVKTLGTEGYLNLNYKELKHNHQSPSFALGELPRDSPGQTRASVLGFTAAKSAQDLIDFVCLFSF